MQEVAALTKKQFFFKTTECSHNVNLFLLNVNFIMNKKKALYLGLSAKKLTVTVYIDLLLIEQHRGFLRSHTEISVYRELALNIALQILKPVYFYIL